MQPIRKTGRQVLGGDRFASRRAGITQSLRVLVTGAAGFIGSHVCDRLIADGHHVIGLDDFTTGSPRNLLQLRGNSRFRFIEHDVTTPFEFEVDRIYNLACPASPVHYQADPVRTTLTSVLGALNCLRLARQQGARMLQASTSEVYGDPLVHPQPESYHGDVNPIGPRACYDEGKRCAESLMMDFHRGYGTQVRIARIFNTYGPRMAFDDGRVVSNFLAQALRGNDLTIYGTGRQTRSFCFVDDLVEGLLLLMEHPTCTGPVNLGNPEEFTVLELAHLVMSMVPSSSNLVFEPLPQDDPQQRRPDISLARSELGFQPKVKLRDGLERMIADFSERLELDPVSMPAAASS